MGQLQLVRDYLKYKLKEEVSITIMSGYRSSKDNGNLYSTGAYATSASDRAKKSSNHVWRLEPGPKGEMFIRGAVDFVPQTKTKCVVDESFKELAKWYQGELYLKKTVYGLDGTGIIHLAAQADMVKMPWVTTKEGDVHWVDYFKGRTS